MTFSVLPPVCALRATSRMSFRMPQKLSGSALPGQASHLWPSTQPLLRRAIAYTRTRRIHSAPGQTRLSSCLASTGPPKSHGILSSSRGAYVYEHFARPLSDTHASRHCWRHPEVELCDMPTRVWPIYHWPSFCEAFGSSAPIIRLSSFYNQLRQLGLVYAVLYPLWWYPSCPRINTNGTTATLMSRHLPDRGFFRPSPDSTGTCPIHNKEFYMFVRLTATTILCSLYGAIAYPLTYMFRLIGYTRLSFTTPSIKLP